MCNVGDFYVGLPVRIGDEECIHIIGGVDASGGVYTAPDPFLVDLTVVEDGSVPSSMQNTHLSVAFSLNPVRSSYVIWRPGCSDSMVALWHHPSQALSERFVDSRAWQRILPPATQVNRHTHPRKGQSK